MNPEFRAPEFDRIRRAFGWSRDGIGVGDDAAVLPDGRVLCCDALAEGVHFRLDWSSAADVGWKAVAQNVADVLAMGARPEQAVWSVGMGRSWDDSVFAGLARGALAACRRWGVELVGGDTVRTRGSGFVSLSLLGRLVASPWLRSGAKAGDRLVLVGTLGRSAAGLALLQAGHADEPGLSVLVSRHRRPVPPSLAIASASGVRAAIDLSDGLSSEAHHLAGASGLALELDEAAIPPDRLLERAARFLETSARAWRLDGGEEHSLLLALEPGAPLPSGARILGRFLPGRGVRLRPAGGGAARALPPGGWIHR